MANCKQLLLSMNIRLTERRSWWRLPKAPVLLFRHRLQKTTAWKWTTPVAMITLAVAVAAQRIATNAVSPGILRETVHPLLRRPPEANATAAVIVVIGRGTVPLHHYATIARSRATLRVSVPTPELKERVEGLLLAVVVAAVTTAAKTGIWQETVPMIA